MTGKKARSGEGGLGKALIRRKRADQQSHHHERAPAATLQSIMDFTDLEVVLQQAEEAGRTFSDLNPPPQVLATEENAGIDAVEERRQQQREEQLYQSSLTVPRRPKWHQKMTLEELDVQESQAFLIWRRSLARLEENEKLVLTPFEKNLEVWRQLWRVIERCDLVVMVVDARNPLFYRCPDLEAYVKEIDENKRTVLLLNKADLLPVSVRKKWATYFKSIGLTCLFWSAKNATAILEGKDVAAASDADNEDVRILGRDELLEFFQKQAENIRESTTAATQDGSRKSDDGDVSGSSYDDSSTKDAVKRVAVGFVGYPNVGKSSTINVLVGQKRTGVTSTPGKTKHFQTLIINDKLMLCDCPGLVFPSFTSSKADMVAAGVLPIDKMTDYRGPIQVIANQISRKKLEELYGLSLPKPKPYEAQNKPPTAAEFLRAFAQSRGYVVSSGRPDETRSARQILRDYLSGKLLYCHQPPNDDSESSDGYESYESDEDERHSEDGINEDEDDGNSTTGIDEDDLSEEDSENVGGGGRVQLQGSNLSSKLDGIFKDVDLSSSKPEQVKTTKVKRAAHKMHKKAPRKKDRSWRAKDDDSEGMAHVRGVVRAVSYGAAPVRV